VGGGIADNWSLKETPPEPLLIEGRLEACVLITRLFLVAVCPLPTLVRGER